MPNVRIEISEEEFARVLEAYKTLQTFMEKIVSPNELYQAEFLEGLEDALTQVETGDMDEVNSYEDFVR
jgi:hypothetical protein